MIKRVLFLSAALSLATNCFAQDEVADEESVSDEELAVEATVAATPEQPRAMSGMSILGNEEAPKALVIVPWKSSELGDDISMSDNLDDDATPVDKEVFLRELRFYEIRKSE
jgi:hypothetical protein